MRGSRSHRPTVRRTAPRTRPLAALPPARSVVDSASSQLDRASWRECIEPQVRRQRSKGEDRYEEPSALSIRSATRKDAERVTANLGGVDMG